MDARRTSLLLCCVLVATSAHALSPDTKDARAIMRGVFESNGAARSRARMKMTIRDGLGTRERTLQTRSLRFEGGRKNLLLIEAPADVRGTGFLSIDYDAGSRADEQWLYLPKLHRVTRVPASGKSDAFVGSDFSYADLSQQDPDDFELKLLSPSVDVAGEDCWLIEALPKRPRVAEETGYAKSQIWISKAKLVPLQIKAWVGLATSTRIKYFKASDVRKIDGVWTSHRLQMRTLDGQTVASETTIDVSDASNAAADVDDAEFTQQRLERGL
ncbi:MAG TPA: outer membrane lipoprotein-sorting protein [Polyangiales bacterium]|nr:outer membrane lipoprotein-sorting protein [Polyangiales bacterium]